MPNINLLEDERVKNLLTLTPPTESSGEESEEGMNVKIRIFREAMHEYLTKTAVINFCSKEIRGEIEKIAGTSGLELNDPIVVKLLNITRHAAIEVPLFSALKEQLEKHKKNVKLTAVLKAAIDASDTENVKLLCKVKTANPDYAHNGWTFDLFPDNKEAIKQIQNAEKWIVRKLFHKFHHLNKRDLTENKDALDTICSIKNNLDLVLREDESSAGVVAIKEFLERLAQNPEKLFELTKAVMLAIQGTNNEAILRSNGRFVAMLYRLCAKKYELETALAEEEPIAVEMNFLHKILLGQHKTQQSPIAALGNEIIFCLTPIPTSEEAAALIAAGKKPKATISTSEQQARLQAGIDSLSQAPPIGAAAAPEEKADRENAAALPQMAAAGPQVDRPRVAAQRSRPTKRAFIPPAADGLPMPAVMPAPAAEPVPPPLSEPLAEQRQAPLPKYPAGSVRAKAAMFQERESGNGAPAQAHKQVEAPSRRVVSARIKALQEEVKPSITLITLKGM
jgi:hypothetical protein